jgi:putative FmdB family regulatory protein
VPIYEFRCQSCGERVELWVRSGEGDSPVCPSCGGVALERLFSPPYVMRGERRPAGRTCCGREERCETPPCSEDETCWR